MLTEHKDVTYKKYVDITQHINITYDIKILKYIVKKIY